MSDHPTARPNDEGDAPRPGPGDRVAPQVVVALKGSPEYGAWLTELADHQRIRTVEVVDQAVVHFARHVGFAAPAPPRIARR